MVWSGLVVVPSIHWKLKLERRACSSLQLDSRPCATRFALAEGNQDWKNLTVCPGFAVQGPGQE